MNRPIMNQVMILTLATIAAGGETASLHSIARWLVLSSAIGNVLIAEAGNE